MARKALLTLASMSLSVGTLVVSFLGCGSLYDDVGGGQGNCEDDKNPCTIDTCASGATMHNPKPAGEACALGPNAGTCDNEGMCQLDCLKPANGIPGMCKCAADSECPTDEACATWACTAGTCTRTAKPDDEVVGTLDAGDCKKEICTAGTKNTVQDDMDAPEDTAGDCQKWTCENKAPNPIADDADTPPDSKGDCQKPTCSNGMPSTANDNADEPPDTGCVNNSCLNGMVTSANAAIGTDCGSGNVCDSKGACVDCLSAGDYALCPACKVKKCLAEICVTAGECKSGFCADGVCCNEACDTECRSCNQDGLLGTCTNAPKFAQDSFGPNGVDMCSYAAGFACDGNGACKFKGGVNCNGMPTACLSGMCSTTCAWSVNEPCFSPTDCKPALTCTNSKCQ